MDPTHSINRNMDSIVGPNTGLLITSYFQKRIQEERSRSQRTNLPFSLIFIDLSFINSKHVVRKKETNRVLRTITDIINENSRETDLKGWLGDHTIAILLPDTPRTGAEILCNRLIKLDKAKLSRYLKSEFELEDYFALTSYPEIFDANNPEEKLNIRIKWLDPIRIQKNRKGLVFRYELGNHSNNKNDRLKLPLFPHLIKASRAIMLQKAIKRFIDITGSLIGIILSLPTFTIIAVAIKLTSPGPIFFKQKRVGFNGKTFTFLKFRSMYQDCDQVVHKEHVKRLAYEKQIHFDTSKDSVFSYKIQNDERVTKIGRFLRVTSLDELPQLIHVLKGEMSLVGPRPYPVYQTANCKIWQHSRLMIKPGITGLGQIYGRYNTTFMDTYRLDLQYIRKWSLWLDFKILIKTVPLVISGRGAL